MAAPRRCLSAGLSSGPRGLRGLLFRRLHCPGTASFPSGLLSRGAWTQKRRAAGTGPETQLVPGRRPRGARRQRPVAEAALEPALGSPTQCGRWSATSGDYCEDKRHFQGTAEAGGEGEGQPGVWGTHKPPDWGELGGWARVAGRPAPGVPRRMRTGDGGEGRGGSQASRRP